MGWARDEGGGVGEQAAGDEPDRTAAPAGHHLTSPAPSGECVVNVEWGKAGCSEESIRRWTAADVFRPGELLEWRAPARDSTPSPPSTTEEEEEEEEEQQFVVLSLNHIMCGLRTDASDFLLRVLDHYGVEWCHLTPNSITALSVFAHLCEAYLGVPPTVEVFAHFYSLFCTTTTTAAANNGRGTAAYFRLRDTNKRRRYPRYFLNAVQSGWTSLWFYARLSRGSCRLTFEGQAVKAGSNWKDGLPLSPQQEQQVRRIEDLSSQGLAGVDIIRDYLKHRITPLRRRAHLSCNYTGPTDPTRDSDQDLSEEDIESRLNYLLDLKKTRQKEPPRKPNVPTSLIRASVDRANKPADLLRSLVIRVLDAGNQYCPVAATLAQELSKYLTPRSSRKSPNNHLVPASSRRYTRQSAGPGKVVPPAPEIDPSPDRGHSDLEDDMILEARTSITTASSPNRGVEQKSIEHPVGIEEGKAISSTSDGKRKFFASPSGSQKKAKYSFISTITKTRMSSLDACYIKGNPRSPRSTRSSHASSVEKGQNSAKFILANLARQKKVAEDSVSNALLGQHVTDARPNEADPAQSIAERVPHQEAIKESVPIAVSNPEEINSDAIWEVMQKIYSKYATEREAAFSEILEEAKKLVMENQRLKDENIKLRQQGKDIKEHGRLLTDRIVKATQETLKGIEENRKLKDEIKDQKKSIEELCKQIKSTQGSFDEKCAEVSRLKEEAAGLMKGREDLQSRVARANELLQLMMSALRQGNGGDNWAS